MSKLIIVLMAVMMSLIAGCATTDGAYSAAASDSDNGGLPEIAAYDDEAIEPLADRIPVDEVMTDNVASDEMSADVSDDGGLPEIAAYDDEVFDVLPDIVSAQ